MSERPTHIRITGPGDAMLVTVGRLYEVAWWWEDGSPMIRNDDGGLWCCTKPGASDAEAWYPAWEPAEAP